MISTRSPLMANASYSANGDQSVIVPRQENPPAFVIQELDAYDSIFANKLKMGVPEIQEIAKKREGEKLPFPDKCALKFQVIDDTAVIGPSLRINGKSNRNRQESINEKKPKLKVGKVMKKKETLEEGFQARASAEKKGKKRVTYSRKDLEALRFESLEDQKKKWAEVYLGLGALVAQEYEGLVSSANIHQKHSVLSFNFDPRPRQKKSANLVSEMASLESENIVSISSHRKQDSLLLKQKRWWLQCEKKTIRRCLCTEE